MITPEFVRTMAAYNAEMNRRLYDAAGRLTEAQRQEARGAFWGSLQGSLSHLLWGDQIWMARFAGWPAPAMGQQESAGMVGEFTVLQAARVAADAGICAWAAGVDAEWLDQDLVWFSGAALREIRRPRGLLVTHLFNHQTHHRGQVHCLLTQFGEATGDTDLPMVIRA